MVPSVKKATFFVMSIVNVGQFPPEIISRIIAHQFGKFLTRDSLSLLCIITLLLIVYQGIPIINSVCKQTVMFTSA